MLIYAGRNAIDWDGAVQVRAVRRFARIGCRKEEGKEGGEGKS
jgi:hypothetical protein